MPIQARTPLEILDQVPNANNNYNPSNPTPNIPITPITPSTPSNTIQPSQMTFVAPITIPTLPQDTTNYAGMVTGIKTTVQSQQDAELARQTAIQEQAQKERQGASDLLTSLGLQEDQKAADKQQAMKDSGATDLAGKLNDLNAQIQNVQLDAQTANNTLESQAGGKDITTAFLGRQQQEVNRQAAIKSLTLNSQYNILKGNYDTAKQNAMDAVDLKYSPIENHIKVLQDQFDRNKEFLTAIDAKRTEALNAKIKADDQAVQDKKDIEKTNATNQINLAKAAGDGGDYALSAKITALDPADKDFKANLALLQAQIKPDQLRALEITNKQLANQKLRQEIANTGSGNGNGIALPQDYSSFISSRTPQQVANFNAIPDNDKAMVAQLVNGDLLLKDFIKNRNTADVQKYINYATSIDPTFSNTVNTARYNFLQKWNDPTGKSSVTRNAINTALGHLADFKASADALDSGSIKKLNNIKNILSTETGDPKVLNLRTDINALASEVATIYKGGTPTDSEIRDWQNTIAADFSKAQFSGVSNEISKLLTSKITATRYQYSSTMGHELDQSIIDPDKRQALIDAGINPDNIVNEKVPGSISAQDLLKNPLSKGVYGQSYTPDVWGNAK